MTAADYISENILDTVCSYKCTYPLESMNALYCTTGLRKNLKHCDM